MIRANPVKHCGTGLISNVFVRLNIFPRLDGSRIDTENKQKEGNAVPKIEMVCDTYHVGGGVKRIRPLCPGEVLSISWDR